MKGTVLLLFAGLALFVSGCSGGVGDTMSDWTDSIFGRDEKPPIPGKRIDVLSSRSYRRARSYLAYAGSKVAASGAEQRVAGCRRLPRSRDATSGAAWATASRSGGVDVGEGDSRYTRITSQPVVANGRVYALDGEDVVYALNAANGSQVWKFETKPKSEIETTRSAAASPITTIASMS